MSRYISKLPEPIRVFTVTANVQATCRSCGLQSTKVKLTTKDNQMQTVENIHETPHDGKPLLCAGAVYLAGF